MKWNSKGGGFVTTHYILTKFVFVELSSSSICFMPAHVDNRHENVGYNFILGMDAITTLGLVIDGRCKSLR